LVYTGYIDKDFLCWDFTWSLVCTGFRFIPSCLFRVWFRQLSLYSLDPDTQ